MDKKISDASQELAKTYANLTELQEELMILLSQEEERLSTLDENEIKRISGTFSKLPQYQQKIQDIAKMMTVIDKRNQKLQRRATYVEEQAKKEQKESK